MIFLIDFAFIRFEFSRLRVSTIKKTQQGILQHMLDSRSGDRVVIVSNYTQTLDMIGQLMQQNKWGALCLFCLRIKLTMQSLGTYMTTDYQAIFSWTARRPCNDVKNSSINSTLAWISHFCCHQRYYFFCFHDFLSSRNWKTEFHIFICIFFMLFFFKQIIK